MDGHSPTPPATPPGPRRAALAAVLAVVLLGAGAFFLLGDGADDAPTDPFAGAVLDKAPSLSDLAGQEGTPSSADVAPDFSVRTFDGGSFTLARHLAEDGRPVLLNLWASWCFPCRTEMPEIDAFAAAHPEVAVIGVAVQDDPVAAEEFTEEIGVSYIIGFDEKDEVNDGYLPLGLPATFLIAPDGTIAKRVFGVVSEESLEADLLALLDG